MDTKHRGNELRRFWGFRQNGRPAFHLGDYIREQADNVAGYSVEFGELDPEEKPAPADCCGVSIRLRCDDLGSEVGPFPGIYDNRPGRGHLYLVADPGPSLGSGARGGACATTRWGNQHAAESKTGPSGR